MKITTAAMAQSTSTYKVVTLSNLRFLKISQKSANWPKILKLIQCFSQYFNSHSTKFQGPVMKITAAVIAETTLPHKIINLSKSRFSNIS